MLLKCQTLGQGKSHQVKVPMWLMIILFICRVMILEGKFSAALMNFVQSLSALSVDLATMYYTIHSSLSLTCAHFCLQR